MRSNKFTKKLCKFTKKQLSWVFMSFGFVKSSLTMNVPDSSKVKTKKTAD